MADRIVVFALRAHQAHDSVRRPSTGLMQYWQVTLQVGYISLIGGICTLLRALLVNATRPVPSGHVEVRTRIGRIPTLSPNPFDSEGESEASPSQSDQTVREEDGDDRPRARWWFRRICGQLMLLSWVPLGIGIVAILGTNAVLRGLTEFTDVSVFAMNLTTALGLGLAAAIGIPGLGLYLAARALDLNTTVAASDLSAVWWTIPVLVLAKHVLISVLSSSADLNKSRPSSYFRQLGNLSKATAMPRASNTILDVPIPVSHRSIHSCVIAV